MWPVGVVWPCLGHQFLSFDAQMLRRCVFVLGCGLRIVIGLMQPTKAIQKEVLGQCPMCQIHRLACAESIFHVFSQVLVLERFSIPFGFQLKLFLMPLASNWESMGTISTFWPTLFLGVFCKSLTTRSEGRGGGTPGVNGTSPLVLPSWPNLSFIVNQSSFTEI